jgi:hypothetical protein
MNQIWTKAMQDRDVGDAGSDNDRTHHELMYRCPNWEAVVLLSKGLGHLALSYYVFSSLRPDPHGVGASGLSDFGR